MIEDVDGEVPQRAEWTQQATGRLGIKPLDDVSSTERDERLQVRHGSEGQRSGLFSLTSCEAAVLFLNPDVAFVSVKTPVLFNSSKNTLNIFTSFSS